ncbi:MAG: TolC family outer membrane protein [Pseudomonadales bacterium]|nr:TolC family outer membrane protein [Pseudomonadales bacterium]
MITKLKLKRSSNPISRRYPKLPLIMLCLLSSSAANANSLTLAEIFQQAEQNDPQWSAMQLGIESQQQILPQTRAGLLPSIALSASTAKKDKSSDGTDIEFNENGYQVQISQPLFHLDNWYQYQYGKTTHRRLDNQLRSERQSFIIRVLESYFSVLRANESLAFAEAESSAVARQLEQTKQRFDVGLIAITDVHESQAAFDLIKVNMLEAKNQVAVAYENLDALTGSDISAIHRLDPKFPIDLPTPNTLDHWLEKSQESNPDLQASKAAQKAARYNKRKALSAYAPDIDLAATYNHASDSQFTSTFAIPKSDTTTLALQLTWTPYLGGSKLASTKEASLKQSQAKAELSATQRNITKRIKNTFRTVNTDVSRVKARQQAITSSQSALEAIQSGYEVGTRNIVDVLQAQRGLFAAKRDYANARYDYVVNVFKLKQLAGALTSSDVEELNQWFNTAI